MNLSLYSVTAFIVLDTDGHRVLAKYYSSKARTQMGEPDLTKGLQNLKEQRAFEKGLFAKTKKPGGAFDPVSFRLNVLCHSLSSLLCRRYHFVRRTPGSVQALAGPHILSARRTAGERAHAVLGSDRVYGRGTPSPTKPGGEASRFGELGLCHSLSGRDDRRWVRATTRSLSPHFTFIFYGGVRDTYH
jgi:hypothetical protein